MLRKATLPAMILATLVVSPTLSQATSDYYAENKKTYGITDSKTLKEVSREVTNKNFQDGSNSVNLGVEGGSLSLKNNTKPVVTPIGGDNQSNVIYGVTQNGELIVSDNRFTGEGWALYLKASPLSVVPKNGVIVDSSFIAESGHITYQGQATLTSSRSLVLPRETLNSTATPNPEFKDSALTKEEEDNYDPVTGYKPTSISYPTAVPIDATEIQIAYAYEGEGMGEWTYSNILDNVKIVVDETIKQDKKAYPSSPTPYQTKFEWTLVSGPGNN